MQEVSTAEAMDSWTLECLFYVGIIVPTVVLVLLFAIFVVCWRRQRARKELLAVLTEKYDPHGTMRRLGIPNKPPPPPVFIHRSPSTTENIGGEDNVAYDMSRSPSTETDTTTAPRLAFHSRLDSGLSERSCHSRGNGCSERDRAQSQASHSSTPDSDDSGFQSSRSAQNPHGGLLFHQELQTLQENNYSFGRKHTASYRKPTSRDSETGSPDSNTGLMIQFSPKTEWPAPTSLWSEQQTHLKGGELDLNDIGAHLGWKYLQELSSQGHGLVSCPDGGQRQALTCHQAMTAAQVHSPGDRDSCGVVGSSFV